MKQANEQVRNFYLLLKTDYEDDLVKQIIANVIEINLPTDKPVHVDAMHEMANKITNDAMKELLKLKKLFKYSVTVLIQQKNGSAMNYGGACYMEDASDGMSSVAITDHPWVDLFISIAGFKINAK